MSRSLGAALVVALVTLVAWPVAAQPPTPAPRTLAVTGEGEVKTAPDLAVISFAVETTAPKAAAAVAENARKSTALADELKRQLGDTGKVSTTRYSVDPVYEQRERGAAAAPPRITGYIVRNQVRAETRAVDSVGTLIDAATTAGANSVDGLEFTLKERAAAQNDALQRAGHDARRQAEAAATALGVKLGKVLNAAVSGPPVVVPPPYARMRVAMAESSAPTPVEAGDVTVTATLQVTYEIE
jgi:uncharacterized protein YggE